MKPSDWISAASVALATVAVIVSISIFSAEQKATRELMQIDNGIEMLVVFGQMDTPSKLAFFDLIRYEDEIPERFRDQLGREVTALSRIESVGSLPSGVSFDPVSLISIVDQLGSDKAQTRYDARELLGGFITECDSDNCASAIASLLPEDHSLVGASYRETLGVLLALSRLEGPLFNDASAATMSNLLAKVSEQKNSGDGTMRDAAIAAERVLTFPRKGTDQ